MSQLSRNGDTEYSSLVRATADFNQQIITIVSKFISVKNEEFHKRNQDRENCIADVCQRTWIKFSSKYQKSPSHINNNVQACSQIRRFTKPNYQTNQSLLTRKTIHNTKDQNLDSEGVKKDENSSINQNTTLITSIRYGLGCELIIGNAFRFISLVLSIIKFIFLLVCALVVLYCLIVLHKPTQAFVSRNTQDFIYPFMRALRVTTLPVIRQFCILTDLYEESCLLSNPFFAMDDLECWPCENARHVIDLTGFSNFSYVYHHSGIPFIVKDAIKTEVGIEDLQIIYTNNSVLLEKAFLNSNFPGITTLDDLFKRERRKGSNSNDLQVKWKINRVTVARLLRRLFPKPYFIPVTAEVSVQHYLFVDEVRSKTYPLPMTEFANVFLTQASGSRYVVLIPTKNCHHRCKVISTVLQPKDVLFYNWLFWRPVSVHVESSRWNISIAYLGSFY